MGRAWRATRRGARTEEESTESTDSGRGKQRKAQESNPDCFPHAKSCFPSLLSRATQWTLTKTWPCRRCSLASPLAAALPWRAPTAMTAQGSATGRGEVSRISSSAHHPGKRNSLTTRTLPLAPLSTILPPASMFHPGDPAADATPGRRELASDVAGGRSSTTTCIRCPVSSPLRAALRPAVVVIQPVG